MVLVRLPPPPSSLTDPNEEVDHEEDVEGEVDLLGGVLVPRDAVLDAIAAGRKKEGGKGH